VTVAVLDTGIEASHDDLSDALVHEECFLRNSANPYRGQCPNGRSRQSGPGAAADDAGHGTHVSGIITSRGVRASEGVAPDTEILAIKVANRFGRIFFFSEIIAALDFIINNPQYGIRVINMSLGTLSRYAGDCDNSTSLNRAMASTINTLRAQGVITFASAGNNYSGTTMTSPACISNVVSVGAADNLDNMAVFSNRDSSTDIFAPGVGVLSSIIGNGATFLSGTSMASPHAAGCAALLLESGEALTPDEIEARLEISLVQVLDPTNGRIFPRIDCSPSIPTLVQKIVGGPDRPLPTPESLTFEILNTSCDPGATLGISLNGILLDSRLADPEVSCSCVVPPQTIVFDDAGFIASLWNEEGVNSFRITSSGLTNSVAWGRVTLGQAMICLFDHNGGDCQELDLCEAGYTPFPFIANSPVGPGDGRVDLAVEVGQYAPTQYDFEIRYKNFDSTPVVIEDTVPAEWNVAMTEDDDGQAIGVPASQADPANSARKIDWLPGLYGGTVRVRTDSREKPNGKYSPTSCGGLFLNDGAQAFAVDPDTDEPLTDVNGLRLPPVVESGSLCLAAVEDVNGDGEITETGSGDEDGDGLTDLLESCGHGTDPCRADTDGDGISDGDELAAGTDPLSSSG
jgi:hypothetical protein